MEERYEWSGTDVYAQSTGINPNDSDIEFNLAGEKRYQKQAKKWSKGKRGKR